MNKSYGNGKTEELKSPVIKGVGIGYATAVILLLLISAIMYKADAPERLYPIAATALLALSSLAGGITAGLTAKSRILIAGLLSGLFFFLPVALISVIISKTGPSGLFFARLILTVSTSSAGAILSAMKKETRISI